MRRVFSQRFCGCVFLEILTLLFLTSLVAYGQSLGDVARENRENQDAKDASTTSKPKVITNADLQKDPNSNQGPSAAQPAADAADGSKVANRSSADRRYARQRLAEQRAAEQWKRQILAQKNKMAALQAQIDQIHASIQSANGDVQSEGPFNRYQARQLQRVAQIQGQLNVEKMKLDQMQDAARQAGMHSAVYDP